MTFSGHPLIEALREPTNKKNLCFILCLFGVLLKFGLIAKSDIPDEMNDPYEYMVQVLHPMDVGVAYGPGTGLFARFFYEFGIPFRLGMEAVFMGAHAWILAALIDWPGKNYLACGLFLFAIFNPAPTELFSHFYSDQIWMVETMAGFAYLVFALRDPLRANGFQLACATILLGFSTITRSVFAPLMACLIFFTLIASILIWARGGFDRFRIPLRTFWISMSSVIIGIFVFYYATCFYNLHRHHYFGISAVDCSEYRNFWLCLQSVGDANGVNYFPVDEDRRNLIAQAGPHSKAFMDQLNQANLFKDVGLATYGKRDLASGWFHFAVFAANDSDTDKSYAIFKQIEQEIRDAAQRGQLKTRTVLPLPDCRVGLVMAVFPGALHSTVRKLMDEPAPYPWGWTAQRLPYDNPEFSRALTRRAVSDSPARYQAWHMFHAIYSRLYTQAVLYFLLILIIVFWIFLAFAWRPDLKDCLSLLAQQLFALLFIALIFWYALFDASGMPVVARYMIYQNVMVPILIAYYLRSFAILRAKQGSV